jgi:ribosome biogenesis GTPase
MARRLSDQQKRRIANKFEQERETPSNRGLVVSHLGQTVFVESEAGKIFPCHFRKNLGSIVVGDQVLWQEQAENSKVSGVITAKEPRHSLLVRASQYKPIQELAANVDQVIVVLALYPEPIPFYLDQHLVAAELQNLPSLIVLNKMDLAKQHPVPDWLSYYQSIGYPIIELSSKEAQGLKHLQDAMHNKVSILVGQSGVGKSSLINSLVKETQAKIGDVSELNKKGKHTTAASHLYHLKTGGAIIDSPGVREFGISETDPQKIIEGFKEFRKFLGHCKFRNCNHKKSQGCAIENAVISGQIHPERLQSYFRIINP